MSVQKFLGTIETDGIKDEMGIETPSLSATGEVSGKTGVFSESVTAPAFNGKATSAGTADSATNATNATNDGNGNNIANTYATKEALAEETSAREAADETLSKGITAEATERSAAIEDIVDGTTVVAKATNATNATNAGTATNANNVTTNINGQPISNIFESDGVTAKKCSLYLHQIQAKYTTLNIIAYFSIINNDNTPFTLNTFLSYLQNKSIQTISASGIVATGSGSELSIVLVEKVNLSGSNITISAIVITNSGTSSWTVSTEELTVGALTDAVSTAL